MPEQFAGGPDWKGQYNSLMSQLGLDPEGIEAGRSTPRFRFNPPDKILLVHVGNLTGVLNDISVGGTSIQTKVPLTVEREFNLSFDQKFRGRVKVVNNILDESEVPGSREMYRTGTRFLNPNDGYRCMVQTLRLYSRISQI